MLQVEIDVFSGVPNPTFELSEKEEKEFLDRIVAQAGELSPVLDQTWGTPSRFVSSFEVVGRKGRRNFDELLEGIDQRGIGIFYAGGNRPGRRPALP